MKLEPIIPIAGITLFILIIYHLYHFQEGMTQTTIPKTEHYFGSTHDNENVIKELENTPQEKDSYPATCTTTFGSTLCTSTSGSLFKHNPDNYDMTYHSIDPAQYFGLKDLIKKDGTINFDKLHDLYSSPVNKDAKVFKPNYYDSVLFSQNRNNVQL
jgi:hypothetical protein